MKRKCVVRGCTSNVRVPSNENVAFHSWPKDGRTRDLWTKFVLRTRWNFTGPGRWTFLCSEHFTEDDYDPSSLMRVRFGYRKKPVLLPEKYPTVLKDEPQPENVSGPLRKEKPKRGKGKKKKGARTNRGENSSGAGNHPATSGAVTTRAFLKPLRFQGDVSMIQNPADVYPVSLTGPGSCESVARMLKDNRNIGVTMTALKSEPIDRIPSSGTRQSCDHTEGALAACTNYRDPPIPPTQSLTRGGGITIKEEPVEYPPTADLMQSCDQLGPMSEQSRCMSAKPVSETLHSTGGMAVIKQEPCLDESEAVTIPELTRDSDGPIGTRNVRATLSPGVPIIPLSPSSAVRSGLLLPNAADHPPPSANAQLVLLSQLSAQKGRTGPNWPCSSDLRGQRLIVVPNSAPPGPSSTDAADRPTTSAGSVSGPGMMPETSRLSSNMYRVLVPINGNATNGVLPAQGQDQLWIEAGCLPVSAPRVGTARTRYDSSKVVRDLIMAETGRVFHNSKERISKRKPAANAGERTSTAGFQDGGPVERIIIEHSPLWRPVPCNSIEEDRTVDLVLDPESLGVRLRGGYQPGADYFIVQECRLVSLGGDFTLEACGESQDFTPTRVESQTLDTSPLTEESRSLPATKRSLLIQPTSNHKLHHASQDMLCESELPGVEGSKSPMNHPRIPIVPSGSSGADVESLQTVHRAEGVSSMSQENLEAFQGVPHGSKFLAVEGSESPVCHGTWAEELRGVRLDGPMTIPESASPSPVGAHILPIDSIQDEESQGVSFDKPMTEGDEPDDVASIAESSVVTGDERSQGVTLDEPKTNAEAFSSDILVTQILPMNFNKTTMTEGDKANAIASVIVENDTGTGAEFNKMTGRMVGPHHENQPQNSLPSSEQVLLAAMERVTEDIDLVVPTAGPCEGLVVVDSTVLDLVEESSGSGPRTASMSNKEECQLPDGDILSKTILGTAQRAPGSSDRNLPVGETPSADDHIDDDCTTGGTMPAPDADPWSHRQETGRSGRDAGGQSFSPEEISVTDDARAELPLSDGNHQTNGDGIAESNLSDDSATGTGEANDSRSMRDGMTDQMGEESNPVTIVAGPGPASTDEGNWMSGGGAQPKSDGDKATEANVVNNSLSMKDEIRDQTGKESNPREESANSPLAKENAQMIDDMVDMYLALSRGERPVDNASGGCNSTLKKSSDDQVPFPALNTATSSNFRFTGATDVLGMADLDLTERGISSAIASLGMDIGGGFTLGGVPATNDSSADPVLESEKLMPDRDINMDQGTVRADASDDLESSVGGEAAGDDSIDSGCSVGGNSSSNRSDSARDAEGILEKEIDAAVASGNEMNASGGDDAAGSKQDLPADSSVQSDLAGSAVGRPHRLDHPYALHHRFDPSNTAPFGLDHPYAQHHLFDPADEIPPAGNIPPASNIPFAESGDNPDHDDPEGDANDDDDNDDGIIDNAEDDVDSVIDDADKEEYSSDGYNPVEDESDCSEPLESEREDDSFDEGLEQEERPKVPRIPKTKTKCRDMEKTISCKLCSFQTPSVEVVCGHLLKEHNDLVVPLREFLSKTKVGHAGIDRTLYEFMFGGEAGSPACNRENEGDVSSECREDDGEHVRPPKEESSQGFESNTDAMSRNGNGTENVEDGDVGERVGATLETVGGARATNIDRERAIMFTMGLHAVILRYTKFNFRCLKCGWIRRCESNFDFVHCCEDTAKNRLCEYCGKTFSAKVMNAHLETVCHGSRPGKIPCTLCGKEVTKARMSIHLREAHRPKSKFTCSICEKELASKKAMELHEASHRKEPLFACPFCRKGFNQKSNMTVHIRQHTGEQPYRCDHCPKAFTNKVCLKSHLKRYHGIDLWKQGQTGGGRPKRRKDPPDDESNKPPSSKNSGTPLEGIDLPSSIERPKAAAKKRRRRSQERNSGGGDNNATKRRGRRGQKRKHGEGSEDGGTEEAEVTQSNKGARVKIGERKGGEVVNRVRRSGRRRRPVKRD